MPASKTPAELELLSETPMMAEELTSARRAQK